MIILDFKPDEDSLEEDLGAHPESAGAAALEETYFVMPMRFTVNREELLAYPDVYDRWRPLPILGLAKGLVRAIQNAKAGQPAYCSLGDGGHLVFELTSSTIRVSSTLLTGPGASVQAAELSSACTAFHERVRQFLLRRVPAIREHPQWSEWFPQ